MLLPKEQVIFNDPVYGFIKIPKGLTFELVEHPFFQRLRRIKQLGLTHLVYPGAQHTRFQHALGATHLMSQALDTLEAKNHEITEGERLAALQAILLHDIGHGPFSHTLERSIVNVHHEDLSTLIMERLNEEFDGQLETALQIYKNEYPKQFLYQLVCSQLDVDRLDYLNRDSFFTGVHEGVIGYDRLIKLLETHNDELVIEAKGIYSVENFIIARRIMYWQVFLHKTVLVAEQMLIRIFERARELVQAGEDLYTIPALEYFLKNEVTLEDFRQHPETLDQFLQLDDIDIMFCIKQWRKSQDEVLAELCDRIISRRLFKIELQQESFTDERKQEITGHVADKLNVSETVADYYVLTDVTTNSAYNPQEPRINILFKDGTIMDVAEASDQLNISVLSKPVKKYYICYPKEIL